MVSVLFGRNMGSPVSVNPLSTIGSHRRSLLLELLLTYYICSLLIYILTNSHAFMECGLPRKSKGNNNKNRGISAKNSGVAAAAWEKDHPTRHSALYLCLWECQNRIIHLLIVTTMECVCVCVVCVELLLRHRQTDEVHLDHFTGAMCAAAGCRPVHRTGYIFCFLTDGLAASANAFFSSFNSHTSHKCIYCCQFRCQNICSKREEMSINSTPCGAFTHNQLMNSRRASVIVHRYAFRQRFDNILRECI